MSETEWDARMIGLWTSIGWHMRAKQANLNADDCINLIAMLMCRISRLEILQERVNFFPFGLLL